MNINTEQNCNDWRPKRDEVNPIQLKGSLLRSGRSTAHAETDSDETKQEISPDNDKGLHSHHWRWRPSNSRWQTTSWCCWKSEKTNKMKHNHCLGGRNTADEIAPRTSDFFKSMETSAICPAAETLPTSSKMTMACSGDDSNGDRQEDESFWNQRDGHDGWWRRHSKWIMFAIDGLNERHCTTTSLKTRRQRKNNESFVWRLSTEYYRPRDGRNHSGGYTGHQVSITYAPTSGSAGSCGKWYMTSKHTQMDICIYVNCINRLNFCENNFCCFSLTVYESWKALIVQWES